MPKCLACGAPYRAVVVETDMDVLFRVAISCGCVEKGYWELSGVAQRQPEPSTEES